MTDTSTETPVLTERRDNVLLITLNRPQVRNAVNRALADGVAAALDCVSLADYDIDILFSFFLIKEPQAL